MFEFEGGTLRRLKTAFGVDGSQAGLIVEAKTS